jgi:RNA recognition motif-containing protein
MDSMLEELSSTMDGKKSHAASSAGFAPTKKGSYVEAGEEQSTTNIFVGNLPTHVTELQLGMHGLWAI